MNLTRISLSSPLRGFSLRMRVLRNHKVYKYFGRLGIALSVLFNVVTGGESNMTFSARNHQWRRDDKTNFCSIIDLMLFWHPEHCRQSWAYWRLRKHSTESANEAIDIIQNVRYNDE